MGTVHIMKQLLEGVEGAITHSVWPYSVKRRPFYHRLQTFQTNSLSRLLKTPLSVLHSGNKCFVIFIPPVANEQDSQHRITAPVVRPFKVIFTLAKYFLLFQVFRTIGENGDGESMMSDTKFRKLLRLVPGLYSKNVFREKLSFYFFFQREEAPTSCQWKVNCRP